MSSKSRWSGFFMLFIMLFSCSYLFADGTEVSYGIKAISMGKAFTAIANDTSAMYWNPAGLVQLKGQGLNADVINVKTTSSFAEKSYYPGFTLGDNKYTTNGTVYIPAAAYYYGLDKLTVAFGMYAISGLESDYTQTEVKMGSKIGILNVGPSIGYQVNDQLSVGASLSMLMAETRLMGTVNMALINPLYAALGEQDFSLVSSGKNWNANFGALYTVNDALKVGSSYRLPQRIILKGTSKFLGTEADFDGFTNIPGKFNLGAVYAWPEVKGLTTSVEMSVTQWSKALKDSDFNFKDPNLEGNDSFSARRELNGKNNLSFGLGNEFKVNDQWTVRLGLFSEGPPTLPGDKIQPAEFYTKFAGGGIGGTYSMGRISIDFGYGRMMGSEIENSEQITNPLYGPINLNPNAGAYNLDVDLLLLSVNIKI